MDLTTSESFPWWLWLANLGAHKVEVIGEGVVKLVLMTLTRTPIAGIAQPRAVNAVFRVLRADGTRKAVTVRAADPIAGRPYEILVEDLNDDSVEALLAVQ